MTETDAQEYVGQLVRLAGVWPNPVTSFSWRGLTCKLLQVGDSGLCRVELCPLSNRPDEFELAEFWWFLEDLIFEHEDFEVAVRNKVLEYELQR